MIPFEFSHVLKSDPNYEAIMEEVYRLRFKVYCEEWGFEDPSQYPDGMEKNEFDLYSEHFIIRETSEANSIIGTARIVCPCGIGYPITKYCQVEDALRDEILRGRPAPQIGEVSRLAISKQFRKRIEDNVLFDYSEDIPLSQHSFHEKRKCNFVHEFYKFLLLESLDMNFNFWYVAMKRGLYVLLKRVGMIYHEIGPEIDYHGLRTPYLGYLDEIKTSMLKKDPTCFDMVYGMQGR